jgi:hypothetical protein
MGIQTEFVLIPAPRIALNRKDHFTVNAELSNSTTISSMVRVYSRCLSRPTRWLDGRGGL